MDNFPKTQRPIILRKKKFSKGRRIFGYERGDHNGARFGSVKIQKNLKINPKLSFLGETYFGRASFYNVAGSICFEICYQIQEDFIHLLDFNLTCPCL